MPTAIRPRRSVLYVPGDKPRALEKARSLDVDGIIFDLEDAVSPENKASARETIAEAVKAGGYGHRELILRVSALDCAQDFVLAHALEIHGVLLPKVDSPAMVHSAAQRTRHRLWCMIETPLGVLRAAEIAGASDRLAGFVAGVGLERPGLAGRELCFSAGWRCRLGRQLILAGGAKAVAFAGIRPHCLFDPRAGFYRIDWNCWNSCLSRDI